MRVERPGSAERSRPPGLLACYLRFMEPMAPGHASGSRDRESPPEPPGLRRPPGHRMRAPPGSTARTAACTIWTPGRDGMATSGSGQVHRIMVTTTRAAVTVAIVTALLLPSRGAAIDLRTERVHHGGATYDVVWVDLRTTTVRLFWKDPSGEPLEDFWRLRRTLEIQGERLLFATNSGIFAKDNTPLGLHVEEGRVLQRLNRGKGGGGNFFLKPNGVFWIADGRAHIDETTAYAEKDPAPTPFLAVQSGPLLLHQGTLHPKLLPTSTSVHVRNGVGLRSPEEVVFAISTEPVNLHGFASLFRDALGCSDALYLDGSLSAMYAPAAGYLGPGFDYVGMLAVTAPAK